eukprot:15950-Heterococcus_DN1.PRE.1
MELDMDSSMDVSPIGSALVGLGAGGGVGGNGLDGGTALNRGGIALAFDSPAAATTAAAAATSSSAYSRGIPAPATGTGGMPPPAAKPAPTRKPSKLQRQQAQADGTAAADVASSSSSSSTRSSRSQRDIANSAAAAVGTPQQHRRGSSSSQRDIAVIFGVGCASAKAARDQLMHQHFSTQTSAASTDTAIYCQISQHNGNATAGAATGGATARRAVTFQTPVNTDTPDAAQQYQQQQQQHYSQQQSADASQQQQQQQQHDEHNNYDAMFVQQQEQQQAAVDAQSLEELKALMELFHIMTYVAMPLQQACTVCSNSHDGLMLAYCVTGTAYQQLSQYKCTLAVETLHKLPPSQFSTGWVQHQSPMRESSGCIYNHLMPLYGEMQLICVYIMPACPTLNRLDVLTSTWVTTTVLYKLTLCLRAQSQGCCAHNVTVCAIAYRCASLYAALAVLTMSRTIVHYAIE